ncbi:bile acid:sodium symporter family protein [Nannochloropsis gaditana]|uniref:Bile acid:sodium symporter family protein n=1 Tax=Nannochloropsis gaditana TaxID=72520 RepID=W7TNG8_9STRA|nr:bile acid:sodium symporter family protein [Nannochloropsis gaditana]
MKLLTSVVVLSAAAILSVVNGFMTPAPQASFVAKLDPAMSRIHRSRASPSMALSTAMGANGAWRFLSAARKAAVSLPTKSSTALASSAADMAPKKKMTAFEMYEKGSELIVNLFPIWTVLSSGLALYRPELFAWFTTKYFTWGLGLLMLSMGITLSPQDFADVLKRPSAVLVGFIFCYLFMPAFAYATAQGFALSPEMVAGLVLVGSINGGQASNLCTYIAKGDVALSVMMTTATTLGAIFMTPLLCKFLLGAIVPVDAVGIALSTVQVVLAPIVLGMLANKFLNRAVKAVLPFSPVVGMVSTCLLVASAVAQCAPAILGAGWSLQIATIFYHLVAGVAGYAIPRFLKFSETDSRTMAIETAMKSSAFGFLLASLHFPNFLVRVPPAVSVVWMAVTGSTLAVIWRFIPVKDEKK